MLRSITRLFVCCLLLASGAAVPADETSEAPDTPKVSFVPAVGSKVIVTVAGAPLKTPEKVVWKAYPGDVYTVALVNGEWLWIAEEGGWLWVKQTISYDTAIEEYSAQIKSAPTAEAWYLRGLARLAHRQYAQAVSDFSESLKLKPDSVGVLNNRGKAYYHQAAWPEAIADFDAAIKMNPNHFVALNNRALCQIALKQFDDALRDLNSALKLNSDYPEALNNRGVVYVAQDKPKKAIEDYTAALKLHDGNVEVYGNRSYAYRQAGQTDLAIADLRTAIGLAPMDFKPVNDLAWMLATSESSTPQQQQEAIKLATQACQMTQYENWNTIDTLAAAHAAAGQFEQATQWVNTALQHASHEDRAELQEHVKLIQAQQPIRR